MQCSVANTHAERRAPWTSQSALSLPVRTALHSHLSSSALLQPSTAPCVCAGRALWLKGVRCQLRTTHVTMKYTAAWRSPSYLAILDIDTTPMSVLEPQQPLLSLYPYQAVCDRYQKTKQRCYLLHTGNILSKAEVRGRPGPSMQGHHCNIALNLNERSQERNIQVAVRCQ